VQTVIGETVSEGGLTEAAHEQTQRDVDRAANVIDSAQVATFAASRNSSERKPTN
jgi:hypothetical protein